LRKVDDYQHKKDKELKHKDTDRAKKLRMMDRVNEQNEQWLSSEKKMQFSNGAGEEDLEEEEEVAEEDMLGEQHDYLPGDTPSASVFKVPKKTKKRPASGQNNEKGDPIIEYDNLFFMPIGDHMKSSVKGA
jgi:hypothetical protein